MACGNWSCLNKGVNVVFYYRGVDRVTLLVACVVISYILTCHTWLFTCVYIYMDGDVC